jgi:hypothetical protein
LKQVLSLIAFFLVALSAQAQSYSVSGVVIDTETKAPLPFVNIVIDGQSRGATTDIDGKFVITYQQPFDVLNLSYLGYEQLRYTIKGNRSSLVKIVELSEVEIMPGENPAHRIIKRVAASREKHNPERLRSFTYTSYNKIYATADIASTDTVNTLDTSRMTLSKVLEKQHLFLSESVSERKFLEGRSNELVIASRISGLKESPFAFLATQMQSFSIYDNMLMVLDKNYLSPVSDGSVSKYLFILEDTLYQGDDSVYVISFRPRKGKTFEALQGVLYINTNGYAVQNVLAEPVDNTGMLAGKIQQKYELIDNKQWFPVQLNTDWYYNLFTVGDSTISMSSRGRSAVFDPNNKIKMVNRSYIRDIVIDPDLKKNKFTDAEVEIAPDASSKPEEFWNKYRVDSLSSKEVYTYNVIDSIGKEIKLDLKVRTYEALAFGKYPLGPVDIDLDRVYTYNEYEGHRAGLGLHTNDRILKWLSLGGYCGYGIRDKGFKYGGDIAFRLHKRSELTLGASYIDDVVESGGVQFFGDKKVFSPESLRKYLVERMDGIEKQEASLSFRALRHFRFHFAFNTQTRTVNDGYRFGIASENTVLYDKFSFTEASLGIRFAYREKFLKTPRYQTSLGSDGAIIYAQVTRGLKDVLDGGFDYMRYDLKIERSFLLREYGKSTVLLNAGYIDSDLPYTMLYNGKGSYEKYAFASGNTSFGTMRMNEFVSDRYASLFFSHNLGKLLSRSERFQPELVLITNVGFGSLRHADHHFNIFVRTMEKGYYESGVLLNSLFRSELFGMGAGALYRYGPYMLSKPADNVAVKFTLSVNL